MIEKPDCEVCGAAGKPLYRAGAVEVAPWAVRRCRQCGLIWPGVMAEAPVDQWTPSRSDSEVYRRNRARHKRRLRRQLLRLERVGRAAGRGALIDIGCGPGHLLEVAAELGHDATGLDVSPTAVASLAARFRVVLADPETAPPPGAYDQACALNVLEHTLRPSVFIRNVRRCLAARGLLLLETPAAEGLWHRVNRLALRILGRPIEPMVHPSGHRYLFSRRAACLLLERAGFEILGMRTLVSPWQELFGKLRAQRRPRWFRALVGLAWIASLVPGLGNRLEVIAKRREAVE